MARPPSNASTGIPVLPTTAAELGLAPPQGSIRRAIGNFTEALALFAKGLVPGRHQAGHQPDRLDQGCLP